MKLLRLEAASVVRGERTLWRNVSFALHAGEVLTVRGRNGCGKSSLLKAIIGLLPLRRGICSVLGSDGRAVAAEDRLRHVDYLGHEDGLRAELQVHDEVRCAQAVARYGLQALLRAPVGELSRGQRRRVALAAAGARGRALRLLDEPTVGLDAVGIALFVADVQAHVAAGGAVLMVSHVPTPAALTGSEFVLGAAVVA